MQKLIRNRIRCQRCGEIIESRSIHDFSTCRCGAVSVDGGLVYPRRLGDDYEELAEYEEIKKE